MPLSKRTTEEQKAPRRVFCDHASLDYLQRSESPRGAKILVTGRKIGAEKWTSPGSRQSFCPHFSASLNPLVATPRWGFHVSVVYSVVLSRCPSSSGLRRKGLYLSVTCLGPSLPRRC